jgi:hypothetical protein
MAMLNMVYLPAVIKAGFKNGQRSARCHFRNGERAALLRAITGANLYRTGKYTLEEAAVRSGSSIAYLRAALTLTEAIRLGWANDVWMNQALRGEIGVQEAVKVVEPMVRLLKAFKEATPMARRVFCQITGYSNSNDLAQHLVDSTPAERTKAAAALGVDQVWDSMVNPLLRATE